MGQLALVRHNGQRIRIGNVWLTVVEARADRVLLSFDAPKDDIALGEPKNCHQCPVAIALHRAMPGHEFEVGRHRIQIDRCGRIVTPRVVDEFIFNFDAGRPVSPFSFDLPE